MRVRVRAAAVVAAFAVAHEGEGGLPETGQSIVESKPTTLGLERPPVSAVIAGGPSLAEVAAGRDGPDRVWGAEASSIRET